MSDKKQWCVCLAEWATDQITARQIIIVNDSCILPDRTGHVVVAALVGWLILLI